MIKHLKLYVSPNVQGSVSIHKIPTTKAKKLIVDSKQKQKQKGNGKVFYFIDLDNHGDVTYAIFCCFSCPM